MDDIELTPIPARRFRVLDVLILLLDSVSELVDGFNQMLMSHANWKTQRNHFEDAARADIEAIVGGSE